MALESREAPSETLSNSEVVCDVPSNKTWYDCNDSLCKTPTAAVISEESISSTEKSPQSKQQDRLIECLYENISQIINSASKQNLNAGDVKRIISTPLSSIKRMQQLELMSSEKKVCRTLFTPDCGSKPSGLVSKIGNSLAMSPAKSPIVFSDSVLLLQEIFQKLSQECKELLRPDLANIQDPPRTTTLDTSGSKYVNDLVKNLRSKEISEGDFATIIGGIAQGIFLEAKMKSKSLHLTESASLPDLSKSSTAPEAKIKAAPSMGDISDKNNNTDRLPRTDPKSLFATNTDNDSGFKADGPERNLPDGWRKTPSTGSRESTSVAENNSSSEKDDSKSSESEMQILEEVIRLGMGLSAVDKAGLSTGYCSSPVKLAKYKSKDVLSGKGKLKLKIYHNSGLVTVHVIRGSKLHRVNGKDLNAYIKISMVPDSTKRVHWRTSVCEGQKSPFFNQKFSFEILSEDAPKRLVFSVWHRDLVKERSELVGCMSFSISRVLDNSQAHKIDGWYRLLREGFGTQKHFAARNRKNPCAAKYLK